MKTVILIIGGLIICVFFVSPLLQAIINQFVNVKPYTKKKSMPQAQIDLYKFSEFTLSLALIVHAKTALSESILQRMLAMRTYELKSMVIENLKEFEYEIKGDNSALQNKIDDILKNFESYADAYMQKTY